MDRAADGRAWRSLIVFILVRTAFFASFIETPEPRYVLECFPAVLALAAQVFARSRRQASAFFDRLRVNGQPEDLRETLLDAAFENAR